MRDFLVEFLTVMLVVVGLTCLMIANDKTKASTYCPVDESQEEDIQVSGSQQVECPNHKVVFGGWREGLNATLRCAPVVCQ